VAERLKRSSITADTVEDWEHGKGGPSIAQVQILARLFRVPARWLNYDEPPRVFDDLGVIDFRAGTEQPLTEPSQNLRSMIEHALAVQAWMAEYRERDGEDRVAIIGARSSSEPPDLVASYLRERFEVERLRAEAKNGVELFDDLRTRVQDEGVLVLRMGYVANKTSWALDLDEFKGFTLIDEDQLAPLIFINRKDLDEAQLFTFAHELAHLVTGGSGVSNEDIAEVDEDRPMIERWCDQVAEELLLPGKAFKRAWGGGRGLDSARVAQVARSLKVTDVVVARRAVTSGHATTQALNGFVKAQRQQAAVRRAKEKQKPKGGPTPRQTLPGRYGKDVVRIMASAAVAGRSSGTDALDLLGVSFKTAKGLVGPEVRSGTVKSGPRPQPKRYQLVELKNGWR
jgi:Zn-dependent peptidase ImmA (M78 family)